MALNYKPNTSNLTKSEAINDLLAEFQSEEKRYKNKLDENLKKLQENYYYYFSWLGEDTYEQDLRYGMFNRMIKHLKSIKETIKDTDECHDEFNQYFTDVKAEYKEFTSRAFNVRSKSTSELSNIASTLIFQTKLEMIDYIEKTQRWFNKAK